MILCNKQITKALIRLRGCIGWSTQLLFAYPQRQVFLQRDPITSGRVEILSPGYQHTTRVAASKERAKSLYFAISAFLGVQHSFTQIAKAVISLHKCAGLSQPLLFANMRRPLLKCAIQLKHESISTTFYKQNMEK